MFAIAIGVFLSLLMMDGTSTAGPLLYLDPNDKSVTFQRILNDSIPIHTGERVVLERKDVVSPWVVALIRVDYEHAREEIEAAVRAQFGIEETRERLIKQEEFKAIDLNVPEDPLFGEGFSGFYQLIPGMRSGREYAIVSKEFNRIDKIDGYSISRWRIGDGKDFLRRPWTIVVVERVDFSREWARDHTGIPWPFKISGTNRLVTETEIRLIDDLVKRHEGASVEYFVPYPAYKSNAVLELMKHIVEAATSK